MKHLIDLVKLDRLDGLIRRRATGKPADLAKRLNMSRSSLFEFICFLRVEMRAPIIFNKYVCSYEYAYPPKFYLGFERDRINQTETQNVFIETDTNHIAYNDVI